MNMITEKSIRAFEDSMYIDEKSRATIVKYVHAVKQLAGYLAGREMTKHKLLEYSDYLQKNRKAKTVNARLSAINNYLEFCGHPDRKIKLLKVQRQAFLEESRELSQTEYKRLLTAAQSRGNERLHLLMLTVCSTGIRIGELSYITLEAAEAGRAEISMKGKTRTVLLPKELRRRLIHYAAGQGITGGLLFRTKSGRPMDRSNICHDMKKLCSTANVDPRKVFPHNLRHLFARTFYAVEKNLSHLADVLGHSRIETTRIYVAVSAAAHERTINKMKLIL
ncbi:tyrosine-type recombinase/integrase [Anaerolentibacter hominis]|uniref:tyrosine-type recombinase/integrase n=1 Tax=Anaerolentibacter hominis TaxID=3079009 RepID=UPI0031B89704